MKSFPCSPLDFWEQFTSWCVARKRQHSGYLFYVFFVCFVLFWRKAPNWTMVELLAWRALEGISPKRDWSWTSPADFSPSWVQDIPCHCWKMSRSLPQKPHPERWPHLLSPGYSALKTWCVAIWVSLEAFFSDVMPTPAQISSSLLIWQLLPGQWLIRPSADWFQKR